MARTAADDSSAIERAMTPEPVPAQEPLPEEVLENLEAERGHQRDQPPGQPEEDQGDEPEEEEHLIGS